jgi:formylglycine-generating enzyme required for sulfatase activity
MEALSGYSAYNIGFRCFADPALLDPSDFEVSETDVEVLLNPGLWSEKGVRAKDNAQMVLIDSASFKMGVANGAIDEKPVHEVTLSSYWIDIYEITNEQYALCVTDGACTEPHEKKSLRQASYFGNPAFNYYPVIAVDREQAAVYCEWAGGRLPTEAEWEYTAKGVEGNLYPWGTTFIASNLNYSGNGNYDTLAVNANPEDVSSFGVYNLGGNVSEWVSDRYQEDWYTVTKQVIDPTGPENGNYYVIRGGSAQTGENNARTADRFFALGTSYSLDRGFRCVVPDAE